MNTEILELTKKLMTFESTKEKPEKLTEIVDFVTDYFKDLPLFIKKYSKNGKPSIVITFQETKQPTLILNAHLDVVEAPEELFIPKIEGDKLFGRGSLDMKGSAALMMVLVKNLALGGQKPSLGLILTTDEEIGGHDGVEYLLKDEGYSCDIVFVPDGGKDFSLIIEEKGIIHFKLKTLGKACHASRPWEGESAVDKMVEACSKLRQIFPNPRNLEDWKISFNVGKIQGGDATNKVADLAECFCDIRYPGTEKPQEILAKIEAETGIKPEIIIQGDAFFTSPQNPYFVKYKAIAEKVLERPIPVTKHPAATDARFFTARKIPVILTEPTGNNAHGIEEWVSINALQKMYQILERFITQIKI